MTITTKSVLLSALFLSLCLYTNAQQDTPAIAKPKQTVIENNYDGVKIKLRVIERSDGRNTVVTQIRNNTSKAVAVLLISPTKDQIKQILAPGETFTGNIGDVTNFAVGTHFFEHKPEEKGVSETIIDWIKIKMREYFILNNGGLEKEEKKGTIWGVRG